MSAEFIWAILIVIALLAGPFAALKAVTHFRISAEQKRRQAELEREEQDAQARGDRPKGFW